IAAAVVGLIAAPLLIAWRVPRWRTYLPIPWAAVALALAAVLASGATDDRRVVLGASSLAFMEVMIVSAIATLFSAFSSPFLSAYRASSSSGGICRDVASRVETRGHGSCGDCGRRRCGGGARRLGGTRGAGIERNGVGNGRRSRRNGPRAGGRAGVRAVRSAR